MSKIQYITVRIFRYFLALMFFIIISSFSNLTSYFIAQRMTTEVSEDVIRVIHIVLSVLAYHSFLFAFIITDKTARKMYYDSGETSRIRYIFMCADFRISLVLSALLFLVFPNAFAVKSLYGLLEISKVYIYIILILVYVFVHFITWFEALFDYTKQEAKSRKEKRERNDITLLIKNIISACLAYPILAYILPIFFPTLRTLPKVVFLICVALLPLVIVLILFFNLFDYIRAFFIRCSFLRKLKKSAKTNGYIISKIKHPYSSLFTDHDERSFSIEANGKKYDCKLLAGLHYGDPMHFGEDGNGTIIRHITLRYRTPMAGPFAKGGMIWQKLPDDLAQLETQFKYSFEGDGKKVLIICPTPHSVYATGYDQNKLLDVNDKVWGYTIMTCTAFINALERDAVK